MELLERDDALDELITALTAASAGSGRVALVGGGAGLGKTSLVNAFLERIGDRVPTLRGACDDLSTPRPLGPLHDIARSCGPALADALARGDVSAVYPALLDELAAGPAVVVVEDAHWADEATLDVLTFLARRLDGLPVLLVLTYRDDETGPASPLQRVLGTLRAPVAVRIALAPLSARAVYRLAGEHGRGLRVHAATGGNPFFVTELLAAEHEGVPSSVTQAVLARVARLPEPTRSLLELLAIVPARAETALLDALCPNWVDDAAPAEERGMLTAHDGAVAFRHELARRAVAESLPALRARRGHARVLAALRAAGADAARLVHHAEGAGADETLAEVAPLAAREAAASGAHREAAAHYQRAVRLADRYPAARRVALLEAFTVEASATCLLGEAMKAAEQALALREEQGDPTGVGRNLRWISWLSWLAGRREEMDRRLTAALRVLEDQPPGPDLAMASADLAVRIGLYGGRRDDAERTAERALTLARDTGDARVQCHVATHVGILPAALRGDDAPLRHGLALARDGGHHMEAGIAYEALTAIAMLGRARAAGEAWLTAGIEYLEARQIEAPLRYLQGLRALHRLDGGDWDTAEAEAVQLLERPEAGGISEVFALLTLARLQTRRGRVAEATATLRTVWTVAETCGLLQHVGPAAAALGEHAVLHGGAEAAVGPLRSARELAVAVGAIPLVAELGFWLDRLGAADGTPEAPAEPEPYLLQQAGDWLAAAEAWESLGFPYERARALADADEEAALCTALDIADRLEAAPLAARVRARLRELGVHRIPRGPQAATRANPAGLTARQVEVLKLLAEGLTDVEIAQRLVLSVRTVNHHVASILDKLGVASRRDAARRFVTMAQTGSGIV